jgi:hypothetical protein
LQVVEDARDGINMLFQLQLLTDFLLARAAENELRRFSCPIDVPSASNTSSSASKRLNLRLLEPALQTRIFVFVSSMTIPW